VSVISTISKVYIFQRNAFASAKALPRLFDPPEKPRIVFETVLKALVRRRKADQHAGRLALARDDDSFFSARHKYLERWSLTSFSGTVFIGFSCMFKPRHYSRIGSVSASI
jgi:hypothetical protein